MRSLSLVILMGLLFGALQVLPEITTSTPRINLTPEEARGFRERLKVCAERLQAVEDLLEGRRTLPETADQFRMLALKQRETMSYLRLAYPGCSDKQMIHHQILSYAKHRLERDHDLPPAEVLQKVEELRKQVEALEKDEGRAENAQDR